jgi:hypothetical protein
MRQNPIWPAATIVRVVLAALIVLGITLVELSVVWAQPLVLPLSLPVSKSPLAGAHDCGAVGSAVDGRLVAAGDDCAESQHAFQNCLTSDCRPGATPLTTSRPHATIVRFAMRLDPDASRTSDAHASLLSLVALSLATPRDGQAPRPLAVPHRPARVIGAYRSIPRPPPV